MAERSVAAKMRFLGMAWATSSLSDSFAPSKNFSGVTFPEEFFSGT
jgi:hypothetical protein